MKVVLVGDPRQLPEIDAGGLFRALATRLPPVELTDKRRQQLQWEQQALDELRHGNPDSALTAYRPHGRIRTGDTAEAVRHRLADDWWDTASHGLADSVMIALRRDDVADHGRPLTLPTDYLDSGHLPHGYAITGHKAQGLTCDHTYTLGTETLYRDWGYVAMSRGRLTN